jgi:hypothetical protein
MPSPLLLAQIDDAVGIATREWTIAGFAIFVWLVTCGFFVWLLKRKDVIVESLALQLREQSESWRADLQQQILDRGEDAKRVEGALHTAAAAVSSLQKSVDNMERTVESLRP